MNQAGIFIQVICAILAAMILTYLANGEGAEQHSYMLCIGLLFRTLQKLLLMYKMNRKCWHLKLNFYLSFT